MDRRMVLATGGLVSIVALIKTAHGEPAPPAAGGVTADGRVVLEAYRGMVEEHLTGVLRAAKTLAATSDARSGQWAHVRPGLAALAAETSTAAAVWFARPDGSYATVAEGPVRANVRDRDYFPGLMAGGDVHSALVVSKSTGHRSIVVAAPVRRDGEIVGAIGASVRARLVSEMIERRAQLPANLVFYALDAHGRTAIHKDPVRMFEHPSDMGDPSLAAAVAEILAKPAGHVDYSFRGSARTAIFDSSDFTGWKFVLAAVKD